MELLYKLLGMAVAVAEEAGVDAGAAIEGAAEVVEGTDAPTTMGLLETVLYYGGTFFPIILMFVLLYFFMIRPEKKRKKKEQDMLAALKRGDRICTIGGIYGTIADIKDDTITLTVGRDNLSMVVTRWAIRSVEDVTIENESEALN